MKILQVQFKNRNGHTLRGIVTLPDTEGKVPFVVHLHGFAGSCSGYKSMYTHLSRALAAQGIGSARFDFYGNGESDGEFEDMSFDGLHTDAQDIFAWAAEQPYVDSEKLFLSGQSMGGYIAASCAPVIQPHGLILLCPGAGMWFGCAQRADGIMQTGKDYADMEGLCYKMAFNYEMAKHPDPFTEAKGYNGPVLLLRADDDRLVDEGTCNRYAQVYTAPDVDTIAGGGHNFATLAARAAVEEKTAAFIKANLSSKAYLQGGFRMQNVILQPIKVGGQTFKNRIMFPPLTTGYEKNGMISEQDMGFYTRLAKGGVGYIVLGDVAPINSFSPTPKLFDDSQIPAFKALADSVHAYGTKLGVQLFHPEYDVDAINSLFMQKKFDEMRQRLHHDMMFFTDEVSEEMLMAIIDKMCACAVRAQKAGVDVIQIHGDRLNGCLCSTRMNHRTDKFGGSLENRVRFARMLTRAIRKAVPDMVIDYKLSIVTPQRGKGGIDEADAVQFAQWLVEDGVDMFHVAQANHTGNMADTIPPMGVQPYGFFVKIAGDIKKAVHVPVSAVGRIVDAEMAARVIESGMADMVAMGRPLLADPDWGTKIAAGKACDIRRCISCNKGCTDAIQNRQFLSCVLNAENGYENTRSIQPAAQKKKIAVLGGGPAGLEAARVAALRGHDVTLFEKTTTLGGQLNIACVPPRKEEMRRAAQDLIHAVCNAGVHLCMGQTRTAEQLKDAGFEAVINAVGAHSAAPRIPGIDSVNVADAWKVLAGEQQVYGTVAVIGGGMVGCETAEYLAARGCKVSVIEMMDKIAAGESSTILPTLLENYKTYGVEQYPSHKVKEFRMDAVVCENKDGAEVTIPCDYIVLAMGARSNEFDAAALEAASIPVYSIGDAAGKAADISNAIRTGYDTACQL